MVASSRSQWLVDALLWALTAVMLAAILYFSFVRQPQPSSFSLIDKLYHAASYLLLTAGILLAAVWRPGRSPNVGPDRATIAVVGVIALGFVAEVLQGLYFDRTADLVDGVANGLGALVALAAWSALRRAASYPAP